MTTSSIRLVFMRNDISSATMKTGARNGVMAFMCDLLIADDKGLVGIELRRQQQQREG